MLDNLATSCRQNNSHDGFIRSQHALGQTRVKTNFLYGLTSGSRAGLKPQYGEKTVTGADCQREISKAVNDYFHILLKADINIAKSTIKNDAAANAASPANQSAQPG